MTTEMARYISLVGKYMRFYLYGYLRNDMYVKVISLPLPLVRSSFNCPTNRKFTFSEWVNEGPPVYEKGCFTVELVEYIDRHFNIKAMVGVSEENKTLVIIRDKNGNEFTSLDNGGVKRSTYQPGDGTRVFAVKIVVKHNGIYELGMCKWHNVGATDETDAREYISKLYTGILGYEPLVFEAVELFYDIKKSAWVSFRELTKTTECMLYLYMNGNNIPKEVKTIITSGERAVYVASIETLYIAQNYLTEEQNDHQKR